MNQEAPKKDEVVCPWCGGDRHVQFITDDGTTKSEKCVLCQARGKVAMEGLRHALMRLVARFPPRQYKVRYVRRHRGQGKLERLLGAAVGSKGIRKPVGRKAYTHGRVPVSHRAYRKWFRTRMTRAGMDYRRLCPRRVRMTLGGGKAFWNWGQRRR